MIGIYLSGTGNTKHCVEKLLYLLDDTAKSVPYNILMRPLWCAILLKEMLPYGKGKKCFV